MSSQDRARKEDINAGNGADLEEKHGMKETYFHGGKTRHAHFFSISGRCLKRSNRRDTDACFWPIVHACKLTAATGAARGVACL